MNEQLLAIVRATITDTALQTQLIAKLSEPKFVVRTSEEDDQFKKNLLATINKDEILKEEKKLWMRRVEDDVLTSTGIKQNPSEPYHEYYKRAVKTIQDELSAIKAEKEKIEASSAAVGGVWKTKYETLEAQSKAAITEKEQALADLQKKVGTSERRSELEKVFSPLRSKFVDQLPSFFSEYQESVLSDVLNKSALIDGVLVLVDENGNPRKDQSLNNIKVESFLSEKFKDVTKQDRQQPGGGTQPPAGTTATNGFNVSGIPQEVTSQNKLIEHLGKHGLLQGTKEFDKAFAEGVAAKNITKVFD